MKRNTCDRCLGELGRDCLCIRCSRCDEREDDCRCPVDCSACDGTGIGFRGDPDTSRCSCCRGKGSIDRRPE